MSLKRLTQKMKRHLMVEKDVVCPGCGGEMPVGGEFDEEVMCCGGCGRLASVGEILATAGRKNAMVIGTVEKPAGTKIVRRELKGGAVGWEVPASGKSGGLLAFGVIWLAISVGVATVMLVARVTEDGWSALFPLGFIGVFIAIGVGMTYFGLRAKYAKNLIVVKDDSVMLVRSLFGRKKMRTVSRTGLKWVKKQVFYEQNYEPVYGVEVKGVDGKLRFGATLEEEEKNWLVSEIRREVGEVEDGSGERSKWQKQEERFVMTLPEQKGCADVAAIAIGMAVSGSFVAIGVLLLGDAGFFRYLWTGFAGFFFLMCLLGLVGLQRKAGVVIEVVVGKESVGVRRKKSGRETELEEVPREAVEAVRVYDGGGRSQRPGHCMEILTRDRALEVVKWESREGLPEFARELAGRMGVGE